MLTILYYVELYCNDCKVHLTVFKTVTLMSTLRCLSLRSDEHDEI